jgi:hypothetical protein
MRSVRGGQRSPYSNEATMLRGLRPPSGLTVDVCQWEKLCVAWTRGSVAADSVQVERAAYDDLSYTYGPYAVVATLAPEAMGYVDAGPRPWTGYQYRVRYLGTSSGTAVESAAVECTASARTNVAPPDLQVSVVAGVPQLTWVNRSAIATGIQVRRASGLGAEYGAQVATLPPGATSFADTGVAPGVYSYTVAAIFETTGLGVSAPAPAIVPPAGFGVSTIVLPAGVEAQYTARGADGGWWRASLGDWTGGGRPLLVWSPSPAGGWTERRLDEPVGSLFADPGILLDAAGRPHVVYARATSSTTSSPPSDIVHEWHDGTSWQREVVAQRTLASSSAGAALSFALAPDGTPVIAWVLWSTLGDLEAAHRVDGAWVIEPLVTNPYPTWGQLLDLRVSPDGTAFLAFSSPSLTLWTHPAGGAWSAEPVPTGSTGPVGGGVLMLRPDGLSVGYEHQGAPLETYPYQVASVTRRGGTWEAPVELGAHAGGVDRWVAASSGARIAFAVPEASPDGLWIRSWDGVGGWSLTRLRQNTSAQSCWIGFDSAGKLLALTYGGPAGAGTATYVLYTEQ